MHETHSVRPQVLYKGCQLQHGQPPMMAQLVKPYGSLAADTLIQDVFGSDTLRVTLVRMHCTVKE